jgi:hypothetical protein
VIPVYLVTSPTASFIFAFGAMCLVALLVTFLLAFLFIIKFRLSHRMDDKTKVDPTKGTALQTGKSRVRFPIMPLEFFFDIILPATLWPWGWLSL